ncbi:MAG: LytR/AlgR family response regulator transcription factor [Ekhidna sp.]
MSKIKVLAAEDDILHANKIEMILSEVGYELVGISKNTKDTLRLFKSIKPDVVLLDIELENNESGVTLAQQLNNNWPVPIIFTTAREDKETIKKATQTNPCAYLVKPIEKASLLAAIELAIHSFSKRQEGEAITQLPSDWKEDLVSNDCFFIKAGGKLEKVFADDILYIELGEDRYCELVTSQKRYHHRSSLNSLEQKLNANQFARVHRGCIVNIAHVTSIDETDLVIELGEKSVSLGKTYKNSFLKRFKVL